MLDSDRQQLIVRTIEMLTKVLADDTKVARKMWDQRAGFPGGHTGSGSPDAGAEPITDAAGIELREYEHEIRDLYERASKLDGRRMHWVGGAYVKPGIEKDRGCEVINTYAPGSFEPSTFEATDVDGRLPNKMRLGRWAYDQIYNNGEPGVPDKANIPTREEVQRHLRGSRVRRTRSTRKAS